MNIPFGGKLAMSSTLQELGIDRLSVDRGQV
jgi:hypothetical protein